MYQSFPDALTWLRWQLEWGADEAICERPVDRLSGTTAAVVAAAVVAAMGPTPVVSRADPAVAPMLSVVGAGAAARAQALAMDAGDLPALVAALGTPGLCGLADTASHLVFGAGPADAATMIVVDAPDDDDDRAGTAFAGEAGALLERMLGSIGQSRAMVRVGCVVPWRPPGGRPPSEAELAIGLPFLRRHVALAAPRRLVLMGPLAARSLLGREAARRRAGGPDWRAATIEGRAIPTVAVPHPTTLRASAEHRRAAWAALRLLARAIADDAA